MKAYLIREMERFSRRLYYLYAHDSTYLYGVPLITCLMSVLIFVKSVEFVTNVFGGNTLAGWFVYSADIILIFFLIDLNMKYQRWAKAERKGPIF